MKKRRTRICRVPPCYGASEEEKAAARPPIPSDNNCVVQFGASYRFNNDVTEEFEHRSVQLYTGFEGGQQYLLVSPCFIINGSSNSSKFYTEVVLTFTTGKPKNNGTPHISCSFKSL